MYGFIVITLMFALQEANKITCYLHSNERLLLPEGHNPPTLLCILVLLAIIKTRVGVWSRSVYKAAQIGFHFRENFLCSLTMKVLYFKYKQFCRVLCFYKADRSENGAGKKTVYKPLIDSTVQKSWVTPHFLCC